MISNFDLVEIHSTRSVLDGKTGIIIGVLHSPFVNDFIIYLNESIVGYDPSIVIIGSCVKLLSKKNSCFEDCLSKITSNMNS